MRYSGYAGSLGLVSAPAHRHESMQDKHRNCNRVHVPAYEGTTPADSQTDVECGAPGPEIMTTTSQAQNTKRSAPPTLGRSNASTTVVTSARKTVSA